MQIAKKLIKQTKKKCQENASAAKTKSKYIV